MRITDQDYVLPIVEALAPHETFVTGANRPLLLTGIDQFGTKDDYVVKFRAAERMSDEACMRELIGLFLAKQMGISCVDPAVIHIGDDFVDLLRGNDAFQLASKSLGYNAGSKYTRDHKTLVMNQALNDHQLPAAQGIFLFDVLIQNSDRRHEKPNMMTDGRDIVIFDHELAFSFVFDIFPNPKPWEVREVDRTWINDHTLLQRLRGKGCDYEGLSQRFDTLGEPFWGRAWELLPNIWQLSEQFGKIKGHIDTICANREAFITQIKMLLA